MADFKVHRHQISDDEAIRKYNEFMAKFALRKKGGVKPLTISQIKACKGDKAHMIYSAYSAWREVMGDPHSSGHEVKRARKHLRSLRNALRKMPNNASKVHIRIHRMINEILFQNIKNGCSENKLPRRFVFKRDSENPSKIVFSSFDDPRESNVDGNCILYRIEGQLKESQRERA